MQSLIPSVGKLRSILLWAVALGWCTGAPGHGAVAAPPNIVIMMADDMGFSDLGCYGGEIATPHLDRLAGEGLRFTQFYNTGRCCPTRASLLTGRYPHQAGVGHMMDERRQPGYWGNLNRQSVTIAEVLRGAGYATYMSGKWHVTRHRMPEGPKFNWPRQRGFDRFFGTIHGAGSFFDPNSLTEDNEAIPPGENFYYTDAISDRAAGFIRDHASEQLDRPFFLYVAYTSPHWPMHAKPEDIARYEGKYDAGWDAVRRFRHERMKAMGLVSEDWPLTSRDEDVPAWDDAADKEWEAKCMEVYAAMIDSMDQGVGRIVRALQDTAQWENTLIFFLADNGGCAETLGRVGPRRTVGDEDADAIVPMRAGALQLDMIPRRTRDGRPVWQGRGVVPGPADTYVAYGKGWANASNTPFREYKHWVHEGGIATPLIVHWPQGIRAGLHNTWVRQPAHLIDLMATCVDVGQARYPARFAGHDIHPFEGVSLRPAMEGRVWTRDQPIFFEHEGNRAVRDGRWKLVAKGPGGPWELYDMEADRSETRDLAEREPERWRRMIRQWEHWAEQANVLPWIWKPPYRGQRSEI